MIDLLPQNVQQYWHNLPRAIKIILGSPAIDLQDAWVCFNVQQIKDIGLPDIANKVVITYHTEYPVHNDLLEFFAAHPDKQFLFLADWEQDAQGPRWGVNVTYVRWLTWHHQLNHIMDKYGTNSSVTRPERKLSSLSFQHEFHKAAVTAYLLRTFSAGDMILSWWNAKSKGRLYYLDPEYFLPPGIANIVLDKHFQAIETIRLDSFVNSPMINSNWYHPAYLDCLFNCTNESTYNNFCMIDGDIFRLPWPYLTEKTWKPLLAGRSPIPVSQSGALSALSNLGLKFVPELLVVDQIANEFDRMFAIWQLLDWIRSTDLATLFDYTYESVQHNIKNLQDGEFFNKCSQINRDNEIVVQSWIC